MRAARLKIGLKIFLTLAFQILLVFQIQAGESTGRGGFMVGFQSGYGRLNLRSDQGDDLTRRTYSMGLQGGYAVTSRVILGLEVNGWLLEPFNWHDEEKGEAVNNTMLLLHVFPIERQPVYLRAALGRAGYTANAPEKQGGSGWGSWLAGIGYEISPSQHFYIAAQISYGRGNYSDVPDILGRVTGRRYRVADISLALRWYTRR